MKLVSAAMDDRTSALVVDDEGRLWWCANIHTLNPDWRQIVGPFPSPITPALWPSAEERIRGEERERCARIAEAFDCDSAVAAAIRKKPR